jgi:hypothetical protein
MIDVHEVRGSSPLLRTILERGGVAHPSPLPYPSVGRLYGSAFASIHQAD